jgi:uncharacterized DUF497 family protein
MAAGGDFCFPDRTTPLLHGFIVAVLRHIPVNKDEIFAIDIFTKCKYTGTMKFEWDEEKRLANVVKHGVDFTDACRLFEGPFMIMTDNRRDYGEIRSIAFGHVESRLIAAAFTKRQDIIRIISARKANDREKKRFKDAIADRLETDRFHEG